MYLGIAKLSSEEFSEIRPFEVSLKWVMLVKDTVIPIERHEIS